MNSENKSFNYQKFYDTYDLSYVPVPGDRFYKHISKYNDLIYEITNDLQSKTEFKKKEANFFDMLKSM